MFIRRLGRVSCPAGMIQMLISTSRVVLLIIMVMLDHLVVSLPSIYGSAIMMIVMVMMEHLVVSLPIESTE